MRAFRTPPHSANPHMRPTRAAQAPAAPDGGPLLDGSSLSAALQHARGGGLRRQSSATSAHGAPARPGRRLGRGRGQPQPEALQHAGKEATGARQPATAGTPEEPYRPSRMPAAFRSPAACTQSAASSASLASTTRSRRAVGPYLVPKYALARIQTRAHMAPCPRLHAPHASVCPAP